MLAGKGGIVVIAGNWEPLAFRRRGGGSVVNDDECYKFEHSEAMAKRLAEAGVTLAIWHCYKGLGFKLEQAEMEYTRRFGCHCRRHGIGLGTYINLGSFFAETFLQENPRATKWLARDIHGHPHSYSEYYRSYYRYRPCLTNKEFVDYVEKMSVYAIRRLKSEHLHFDNNAQMPCYCANCLKMFPMYLRRKYRYDTVAGARIARHRFGYSELDQVVLPRGTARMPIDSLPALTEPVLQEWVAYRCDLLTEAVSRMSKAVSRTNPKVSIGINSSFDNGQFAPLVWGNEVEDLARNSHFLFSEDGNYPRVTEDKRLISHIGTYLLGRALGNRIVVYQPTGTSRVDRLRTSLSLMEAAVFNQGTLGHVYRASEFFDGLPKKDIRSQVIRFVQEHVPYFTQTDSVPEVALLHSRHSLTNNWADALQSKMLMEQVLIQYGIQFNVVLESQLKDLARHRVLILPNTISLPEGRVRQIGRFVRDGGTVVCIETAAACDEWGRKRSAGSQEYLRGECDRRLGSFQGKEQSRKILVGILGLEGTDAKRVFHIPRIEQTRPFVWDPGTAQVPMIDNCYRELPPNHREIITVIRHALGQPPMIQIPVPSFIVPQLSTTRTGETVLHFLNYDVERPVRSLSLRLGPAIAEKAKRIETFALGNSKNRFLNFRRYKNGINVTLPGVSVYRAVVTFRNAGHERYREIPGDRAL